MRSRRDLATPLLLLLTLGGISGAASAETKLPPPNLVVFLADDMGMGDTSVYQDWTGNADDVQISTPSMERLARAGIRFTDAHSPSSRCSPSRYALLTGRYCWRTHLKHWVLFGVHCDPLIERDRVTMPEFLKGHGYRTGMTGKWHLGVSYRNSKGEVSTGWAEADLTQPMADTPVDHGFEFARWITRSHPTSGPHANNGKAANGPEQNKGPGWIHNRKIIGATKKGRALKKGSYVLREIGPHLDRHAMSFLGGSASDTEKPFFFYYASPSNHTPHTPCDEIAGIPVKGASVFQDGSKTGSERLDFIHENDVLLGRLLAYLDETDDPRRPGHRLRDNTLVIFSADNGAESKAKTATGPIRSNKGSVYEGGHRVPFFASWPAGGIGDGDEATPGVTSERLLALTDLYATFAEILSVDLPAELAAEDSHSQLAALRGEAMPARAPVFSNDHNEASKKLSDDRAWIGISSKGVPGGGQWKLLLDHRYAFDGELHPQELYRLSDDLAETRNLVDDPEAKPALDFLLRQAVKAAGDEGRTRKL